MKLVKSSPAEFSCVVVVEVLGYVRVAYKINVLHTSVSQSKLKSIATRYEQNHLTSIEVT